MQRSIEVPRNSLLPTDLGYLAGESGQGVRTETHFLITQYLNTHLFTSNLFLYSSFCQKLNCFISYLKISCT